MIRADQIPDEVFEAFQKAWAVTSTLSTKECLAAALNAWPEVKRVKGYFTHDTDYYEPAIILPLNTETDNAEV